MNTFETMFDGEQIGTKMHSALWCLGRYGAYQSKNDLATTVGPHGSQKYGYRIVNRCISAGLATIDRDHDDANPHGKGAVVLTEKGKRYLAENTDLDVVVSVTVAR